MPELPGNFDPTVTQYDELRALGATHIPEDFNEWYFICATYNPDIYEPGRGDVFNDWYYDSTQMADQDSYYSENHYFWMNNINPHSRNFVANSGYGNQSKVEIISKTDLLRARGYKV